MCGDIDMGALARAVDAAEASAAATRAASSFLVCSFTRPLWTTTVQPHTLCVHLHLLSCVFIYTSDVDQHCATTHCVCVHLHVGCVPVPALCERCGAASADVGWGVGRQTHMLKWPFMTQVP